MVPHAVELVPQGGLNPTLDNAVHDGGPRNGVMTALEDFVREYERPVRTVIVPIHFGLAIVVDEQRLEDCPRLVSVLDELESAEGRYRQLESPSPSHLTTCSSSTTCTSPASGGSKHRRAAISTSSRVRCSTSTTSRTRCASSISAVARYAARRPSPPSCMTRGGSCSDCRGNSRWLDAPVRRQPVRSPGSRPRDGAPPVGASRDVPGGRSPRERGGRPRRVRNLAGRRRDLHARLPAAHEIAGKRGVGRRSVPRARGTGAAPLRPRARPGAT